MLEQLPDLAISIGSVLGLRKPSNQVIVLGTYILSYSSRRLSTFSTDFDILLEDRPSATTVLVTLQTNFFADAVIENFNSSCTLDINFSVHTVSSRSLISEKTSNILNLLSGVFGGITIALLFGIL